MSAADQIRAELIRAARSLGAPEDIDPVLERPRDPSHGDWATNLAMVLARPLKSKPRDIAERLRDAMKIESAGVSKIEVAGPGFMNFWLDAAQIASGLRGIILADESYGRSRMGRVVSSMSNSFPRTRQDAARRSRSSGCSRRRNLDTARRNRLERHARVLLQRRRRPDRESCRQCGSASKRAEWKAGCSSRRRLPRGIHPRARRAISGGRRWALDPRIRGARATEGAGPRPPGVRRAFRPLFPRVLALPEGMVDDTVTLLSHPARPTSMRAPSGSAPRSSGMTRIA